jgi:hypothetical protein
MPGFCVRATAGFPCCSQAFGHLRRIEKIKDRTKYLIRTATRFGLNLGRIIRK